MTALDLDAIEALEREATPGPWESIPKEGYLAIIDTAPGRVAKVEGQTWLDNCSNAAFLAALRNSFPALAAELRAAREAVESVVRLQTEWLEEGRERNGPQSSWSHGCDLYEIIAKFDRAIEIAGGARSSLKEKP